MPADPKKVQADATVAWLQSQKLPGDATLCRNTLRASVHTEHGLLALYLIARDAGMAVLDAQQYALNWRTANG